MVGCWGWVGDSGGGGCERFFSFFMSNVMCFDLLSCFHFCWSMC